MPTYQLVCDDCGTDYEIFLTRVLKDSDKTCPNCGSTKVRQVYRDFFGFRLGSGNSSDQGSGGCGSLGGFR